jgi:hypothetical protein
MPNEISAGPNRVELYDDSEAGTVVYVAIDPDGAWARSEFPDELMTLDYDEDDRLIGVELIGDLAQTLNHELVRTMLESLKDPELLQKALGRDRAPTGS